jgi:ParB family chromosome partitioning protein
MAKRGLGRGLNALIPSMGKPSESESNVIVELSLDSIVPNRNQPRNNFDNDSLNDLAESIKEFGVIQPIVVRKLNKKDKYEIIVGERRYRATKKTSINTIPSIIVKNVNDVSSLEMALIENLHRDDLNPMEKAYTFKQLIDEFKITHDKLSKRIGKSRAAITNSLRLLSLPEEVQRLIGEGKLSEGHARSLLGIEEEKRVRVANLIVKNGLSVRDVEKMAGRNKERKGSAAAKEVIQFSKLPEISRRMSEYLGANVNITIGRKEGKIVIEFATVKELERIAGKIFG